MDMTPKALSREQIEKAVKETPTILKDSKYKVNKYGIPETIEVPNENYLSTGEATVYLLLDIRDLLTKENNYESTK